MGEEFTKVADTKDIEPSQMKAIEVGGESICLIISAGNTMALVTFVHT